jgi:hypothetical protein
MSEYRSTLERVGANFSAPGLTVDRVVGRRDRLRRNRRVAAGIVGVGVAIAVAVGGATLLRSAPTPGVDEPKLPRPMVRAGEVLDEHGGRIYALDPVTGDRRELATIDCQNPNNPCNRLLQRYELSADGRWLLYDAWTCVMSPPCDPDAGIWIVDAHGEPQQLDGVCDPPGSCLEERWAWSSTGHRLAISGGDDDSAFWLLDAATGERTALEPTGATIDAIAWEPEGPSLAYATASDLMIIEPETDGTVTEIPLPPGTINALRWSPDETRILLDTADEIGRTRIYVADLATATMRLVADDASNSHEASAWSPDGTRIAYVARPPRPGKGSYGFELWVIDSDGSDPVQLFHGGGDGAPVWSPDGTSVAVNVETATNFEWAVFAADGSGDPTPIAPRVVDAWMQAPGLQHADP